MLFQSGNVLKKVPAANVLTLGKIWFDPPRSDCVLISVSYFSRAYTATGYSPNKGGRVFVHIQHTRLGL